MQWDLSDLLVMDWEYVECLERELAVAKEKIKMLEATVAKLEAVFCKVANVVDNTSRQFNALYDVHGC